MRIARAGAIAAVLAITGSGALVAAPATAVEATSPVLINEIEADGGSPDDWIEFVNPSGAAADISGFVVKDDDDAHAYVIPDATTVPAGGYLVLDKAEFGFGLGKSGDAVRLYAADGTTLVDSYTWSATTATSVGRCPDATGPFAETTSVTKGAANDCSTPHVAPTLAINEVVADGGDPDDWIELVNTGSAAVDAGGVIVKDDDDTHAYVIPDATTVPAGGYLVLDKAEFGFGLGKSGDAVRLYDTDGVTLLDTYTWTATTATSYGRCPDATGPFGETASVTKGAANDCATAALPNLVINELESNGDDTDWVEIMNLDASDADISGYVFKDDKDSHAYVLPTGSVVSAGGLFVIDQKASTADGFDFGLGNPDEARLFAPDGATLVASYAYTDHAVVTWARCPDGTGEFADATSSTKGAPNDCSVPARINEVESKDGDPGDWVELVNTGVASVDLAGYVVRDNDDAHGYAIPTGTVLSPGAYLVIDEADLGFGLGGTDSVRLFAPNGTTLVDSFSWTAHASTTYGRCPDGSGDFAATASPTKGVINDCAGFLTAHTWPGGTAVSTVDDAADFSGDLSGLDFDATTGTLWGVENGNGLLYRFQQDASGAWGLAPGWESGVVLHYPGGGGTVDAEGVTVTGAGTSAGVYVSSERNNDASSVSRPAVLKYDVGAAGASLTASAEWNLAPDFPGLGANQGLEGVTWVSDAFLTARGFLDEHTGAAYSPASYAGHGSGLFVVAVEGTASMYAYALMPGGAFQRVATIPTTALSWPSMSDVQFDAERGTLFAVCDDACGGQIAAYTIQGGAFVASALYARPGGMANVANEGFALADASFCTAAGVPTFYADDADTDGFSLRTGTFPCTPGSSTVTGPATVTPGGTTTFGVGSGLAGQQVDVWLHSTPVLLGHYTVSGAGTVSVTIPSATPAGPHTLVVLAQDGTLVGTTTFRAGSGVLAFTGADGAVSLALIALTLLLAGAAALLARRRRV